MDVPIFNWFLSICFVTILINPSLILANDSISNINQLELNRLFISVHHDRMQKKASMLAPGAHNHELENSGMISQSQNFASQPQVVRQIPAVEPQRNMMNSFMKSSPNSINIDNFALTSIETAKRMIQKRLLDDKNPLPQLAALKAPPRFCPFKNTTTCDPLFPYRSFDGSCNNLKNTWWGQAEMPYRRILEPDYADGLNEPRRSADGSELPNPRDLACGLHSEVYEVEPFVTNIFMQWGQTINHDMTSLSITMDEEEEISNCRTCEKTEKCHPIMMTSNVTCNCISQMKHKCIEFKRSSASFPDPECSMGKREQLNLVTPLMDGSLIYGESETKNEKIRDRENGKGLMLVQENGLLPQDPTEKPGDCLDFSQKQRCFLGGDDRINQNPGLMGMSTIIVREHNRIARILASLNPQWEDETVFQETRRIVVAMMQHITYNEYIPILLGPTITQVYDLIPDRGTKYFTGYNPNIDPRLANEWAAATGRFGHSMIRGRNSVLNSDYQPAAPAFNLRNAYFRANSLYDTCHGGMESVVRGLLKDPIMKIDRHFTNDITQHLFETHDDLGRPFHFDLIAINIARGRDHGVPSYIKFRSFCQLPELRTWTELRQAIPDDAISLFRGLYKFVDDIDLFTGLVSEKRLNDALVGPTLACLLAIQYRDIKFGDRFWYETNAPPARFSTNQLNEIRKFSLSKLLCRNMNDTPRIQPRAMVSSSAQGNSLVECSSLPDINWQFWRAR